MRELFVAIEQQRVSRDAIENLGPPSEEKFQQIMKERSIQTEQSKNRKKG